MTDDLLISLRKYRPREGKDPIENFFTEAFAWILKNEEALCIYLLDELITPIEMDENGIQCDTQANFNGVYPDMIITISQWKIIFENKVWAPLGDNQITNYRQYAASNFDKFKIVLLTASPVQHTSSSTDVNLCWNQVYTTIEKWLDGNISVQNEVVIRSFLKLLKNEGVGPKAPIDYSAILYYNTAKQLPTQVDGFLSIIENRHSQLIINTLQTAGYTDTFKKECSWGRYGFGLFEHWNPGLFIGFMLEERDHNVDPLAGIKSPDLSIIVSFDRKYHAEYPGNHDFKQFKNELKELVQNAEHNWDIYDISGHGKGQNKWHPLHIRVPMADILKGTDTIDEQIERFFMCFNDLIPKILSLESFRSMKTKGFIN